MTTRTDLRYWGPHNGPQSAIDTNMALESEAGISNARALGIIDALIIITGTDCPWIARKLQEARALLLQERECRREYEDPGSSYGYFELIIERLTVNVQES